jgi:hypothetical protein
MSGKTDIERRTVLSAITAASGAALSSAVLSRLPLAREHRVLPMTSRRPKSRPLTTPFSLGVTAKDPRC